PAGPRSDLPRGRAGARARDRALDRPRGRRARTQSGGRHARARSPLEPLFRTRGSARGACRLPGHGRAQGLRYHRDPLPGAGGPAADQGWRAPAPGRTCASGGVRAHGRGDREMSRLVQVALAEDVTEAEEIQAILQAAGISSELETAVEHHPQSTEDAPQKVLVPESHLEAAQHAIEAMTDPDEIVSDA